MPVSSPQRTVVRRWPAARRQRAWAVVLVASVVAAGLVTARTASAGPGSLVAGSVARVAVIGDFGSARPPEGDVADLVRSLAPDVVATVGDNRYSGDIDRDVGAYYADWIGAYDGAHGAGADVNRFFPAIGNHDVNEAGGLERHLDYFTLPGAGVPSTRTSGNERYYDVVVGPVHLFVLNSDKREPHGRSASSRQARWLRAQLAASTADWQVVLLHHPPFSSGRHGSDRTMRWPFAAWGADAVLAGHDHLYERFTVDGIPYLVNGVGGATLYGGAVPMARSQVLVDDRYGAVELVACASRLELALHTVDDGVADRVVVGGAPCAAENAPPVATDDRATTAEGVAVEIDVVANDVDDDLRRRSVDPSCDSCDRPDHGTARAVGRGVVAYAPARGFVGVDTFDYEVCDRAAQCDRATVSVTVGDARTTVLTLRVERSADDAEENARGRMRHGSSDLELVDAGGPQVVGMRFTDVALPRGATIVEARLQLTADEDGSGPVDLTIAAQASDDAPTFSSARHDLSGRRRTTAGVTWAPLAWTAGDTAARQRSPDLAAVLQEVVDRPGWTAGNALALLVTGTGTRTAVAHERDPRQAPVLHVTATAGRP